MKFIADLHIHSRFSRATSKQLNPVELDYWAKIKGVNVVGTGDFTHPAWTAELKEHLEEAEEGLYRLKKEFVRDNPVKDPPQVRFMLSAEISNIYKKNGKVRKIHNVVLAPDFEAVEKIQRKLADRKFNITSDGRPILGMDARDLLEMLLETDERIFFIPAHIWTPWFAVLGSKSGFDSIEECFEDMTRYIWAAETGLSSDQPMNWICSFLDKFTMISNSDAHSPEKLGRNANIFSTDLSYQAVIEAMKHQDKPDFVGTIDLYPQEGKYHYDGHRKCGVRFDPVQTLEHGGICPVCGKPLTLGVAHRVASLADRDNPLERPHRKEFHYIIPLKEILGEINKTGSASKKVDNLYFRAISQIGNENYILLEADYQEIKKHSGELLAEAIRRMRQGQVIIEEGFDGEYGKIKLFEKNEISKLGNQVLFEKSETKHDYSQRPLLNFDVKRFRDLKKHTGKQENIEKAAKQTQTDINQEQKQAIEHEGGPAMVIAGPGTGKTYTLIQRIAYLVKGNPEIAENILTITFTNQAAGELQNRLKQIIPEYAEKITVSTFHAFGYRILKDKFPDQNFIIITDEDKRLILKNLGVKAQQTGKIIREISITKNKNSIPAEEIKDILGKYNNYLKNNQLLDFDDLIYQTIQILKEDNDLVENLRKKYQWILIDEFQDINPAQYDFVKILAPDQDANIFAIGDPNQSIYGFRGSDKSLTDKFINEYQPRIYTINTSYRVPQQILEASTLIINNNQDIKSLRPGIKIKISNHPSDKAEAEYIAREIEKLIGGLRFFSIDSNVTDGTEENIINSLSEIAVLVRTQRQFPAIIKAFQDHSIPYQIIGEKPFYKMPPVSEIIDILEYLLNPDNNFLKQKILPYLSKIKDIDIKTSTQEVIKQIVEKTGINNDQVERLINIASGQPDLHKFLNSIKISDIQDDYQTDSEAIALMTLHASKGLEFDCVFIPGLEEGLLPYTIYKDDTNIEEERRLLYVGMTRSKRLLYISHAKSRYLLNRQWQMKPSRFLKAIKQELLEIEKNEYKTKPKDNQLKLF